MKKNAILTLFLAAAGAVSLATLWAQDKPSATADNGGFTLGGRPIQEGQRISDFEFEIMRMPLPAPSNEPWTRGGFDSKNAFEAKNQRKVVEEIAHWIRMDTRDPGIVLEGVRYKFHADQPPGRLLGTLIQFLDLKDEVISTTAALELYRLGDHGDLGYKKMRAVLESDRDIQLFKNPIQGSSVLGSSDARSVILRHALFYKDARFLEAAEALWKRQQKDRTEDLEKVDVAWYLEVNGKPRPDQYWLGRLASVELNGAYSMRGLHTTLMVLEHRKTKGAVELLEEKFRKIKDYVPKTYSEAGNVQDHAGLKPVLAASLLRLTQKAVYRQYLVAQVQAQIKNQLSESTTQTILDGLAMDGQEHSMAIVEQALQKGSVGVKEAALVALASARHSKAITWLRSEAKKNSKPGSFPQVELRALLALNSPEGDAQYMALKKQLVALGHVAPDFDAFEFYRLYCRDEVLPPIKPEAPAAPGKPIAPPATSPGQK